MPGPYTYNGNIPQPTDQISVSQGQILTNFTSIGSMFSTSTDIVGFSSSNASKHNQSTYVLQTLTPTFTGTEFGIWNESDGSHNQIWLNNPTSGKQIAWSSSTFDTNPTPSIGGPIWTSFASGFILQAGAFSVANSGIVVNFAVPFPNQIFSVVVSLTNPTAGNVISVGASNISTSGFTVRAINQSFNPATNPVNGSYIAIGY